MGRKKTIPTIKFRLNMPLEVISQCKGNRWTVSGAVKVALPKFIKSYRLHGEIIPGKNYTQVKTTSINIPSHLADSLNKLADETGLSKTAIILQALENFLDKK
jgi:hypothetical protein